MGAVNLTIDSKYCTVQFCEFEDYPIGVQMFMINYNGEAKYESDN